MSSYTLINPDCVAAQYTDASLTVVLPDGTFAFADGDGKTFRRAVYMIPGYDYRYGESLASGEFSDAHEAIKAEGYIPPQGSCLYFEEQTN